ncbi:hypothetical protein CDG77_10405 [Nostoc sp. 'Peltigera membranacea cyanobiont' 213]|uniref:hypothetical protein n=1 Tax=Nostoc cyanobionts TaxID=3123326 RepID=UPI000B95C36F|nr:MULTISPECIES: hypothetical protein [unclassified Nostoc]OYD95135.1 hypothetical protein CDG77_10405 [Nostoc sp. 'Peltigera membranacea cyanobiont' 213]
MLKIIYSKAFQTILLLFTCISAQYRNRLPEASAEIIEAPKIITSRPDIGYWIDSSRVGVKPCANELKG